MPSAEEENWSKLSMEWHDTSEVPLRQGLGGEWSLKLTGKVHVALCGQGSVVYP